MVWGGYFDIEDGCLTRGALSGLGCCLRPIWRQECEANTITVQQDWWFKISASLLKRGLEARIETMKALLLFVWSDEL